MTVVTALLAEDEAPQREALVRMLAEAWPELRIDALCEDGLAALESLESIRPDIAFLDIRMPGANGLEVARRVSACGGLVVFTTAYDRYAVQAFEAGAVDYLLKPILRERLDETVARLKQRLTQPARPHLDDLLRQLEARLGPTSDQAIRWISASIGDSVRMLGIDEVLYFHAQDKYVRVVTAADEAVIRTPLRELLGGLDADTFWQVHRSVIVRVAAIERVRRDELGKLRLHLRGRSETLPVSSAFQGRFRGM
ncbi:MAG TPA: LytTR family DNA-binding domain-containing protein [Xanthomonadaceae bacterium]|nr:LytTR family DNA-binding domain-containing protein [Xanthomonadaceae bacterium]